MTNELVTLIFCYELISICVVVLLMLEQPYYSSVLSKVGLSIVVMFALNFPLIPVLLNEYYFY